MARSEKNLSWLASGYHDPTGSAHRFVWTVGCPYIGSLVANMKPPSCGTSVQSRSIGVTDGVFIDSEHDVALVWDRATRLLQGITIRRIHRPAYVADPVIETARLARQRLDPHLVDINNSSMLRGPSAEPKQTDLLRLKRIAGLVPKQNHLNRYVALPSLDAYTKEPVVVVTVGTGRQRGSVEHLATNLKRDSGKINAQLRGHRDGLASIFECLGTQDGPSPKRSAASDLIESTAASTPAVGTNIGGLAALVGDGVTGPLAGSNDPNARAKRLKSMLVDAQLRSRGAFTEHFVSRMRLGVDRLKTNSA